MRAVRTTALVSLLALAAAACGGAEAGSAPDRGLEPEAVLQQATAELATQTVQLTFSVEADAEGQQVSASGEMAIDPERELAHLTVAIDGLPGLPGAGEMELVIDRTTVYVRGDVLPDAGWLKIDADHPGMHGAFGPTEPTDPAAFLEALQAATDIEVAGTEEIRGVPTTHFRGTLDLAAFLEEMPAGEQKDAAAARDAFAQFERQMGELNVSFDAWVDGDQVPRRFRIEVAPETAEGSVVVTMDVLEIGGELDIEVPSGKDVTDLGALDGSMAAPALA